MSGRMSWDDYFLALAKTVSFRADCRRARHGCVIVDTDKRVAATGYNGSAPGGPSCLAGECPRGLLSNAECASLSDYSNCHALHAEVNAVANADARRCKGGTVYLTGRPCDWCQKVMRAAGIARVVWPGNEMTL